jgi:hypothetical protein
VLAGDELAHDFLARDQLLDLAQGRFERGVVFDGVAHRASLSTAALPVNEERQV